MQIAPKIFSNEKISLSDLTFLSTRLKLARFLVAFCFVWPFFNYKLFVSDNTPEINFLPVFVAALLLPEVALREVWSIVLALPAFAVALLWANPTAPARLAISILPLHFVLNLTHYLHERGKDLLPSNLAYRALQIFVAFCVLQTVQFQLIPVIPEWLTTTLTNIVPRYSGLPYDDFGIRGVQGWASEPSGAALTSIAFAIVAIVQRPDRRWRVLSLYVVLLLVNKSVYALILATLLGICCMATLKRKIYSLLALAPMSVAALFYMSVSNRLGELRDNIMVSGMDGVVNRDLTRFVQILSPIQQFPHLYKPASVIFDGQWMVMEPLGLLPVVIGYGSILGLIWIVYMIFHNYPSRSLTQRPLAFAAGLILLILTSPDLIPAVVALAVCLVPPTAFIPSGPYSRDGSSASSCVDRPLTATKELTRQEVSQ
jgi:hypothetical protein